jgi:hypothetical protein
MPRKTAHRWCVKCEERAQLGVYTGYYVLSVRSNSGNKAQQPKRQVTATLPARGFCVDCFLHYARAQGWGQAEMKELRTKLRGAGIGRTNADR